MNKELIYSFFFAKLNYKISYFFGYFNVLLLFNTGNLLVSIMNRGMFLLPSICTLVNMGAGLYSILLSINGRYTTAAWAIIIAMISDGFDGLIARATKTTSDIGIEFDSFADFVSFCIAPAVLMYFITLWQYRSPGLIVAFIYILTGALRLARYNINSLKDKLNGNQVISIYFEGLPTPAAAGILASFVLVFELFQQFEQGITAKTIPILMGRVPFLFKSIPVLMIILGFLMLSKIQYTSFTRINLLKRIRLRAFLLIAITVLLIIAYPENMIFIIFGMYILFGLIDYIFRVGELRKRRLFKIGNIKEVKM